jgi:phage shock protein E
MPSFRKAPVDIVIDVRSHIEFWMGHLPGAECMPVDSVVEKLAERTDIKKSARILVYCASGARSTLAASALTANGYTHVRNGGGLSAARAEFAA